MNNYLTNKQLSFILYCLIIGCGVINLPKNAAESAGIGAWLSLIITTIIFMFITYMITYLQYVYEGETLYEYSQQLVGKLITYLLVIIYIIYFFINLLLKHLLNNPWQLHICQLFSDKTVFRWPGFL
jgi:spore germination protein